ncbi:MAG: hypothetical protein JW709_10775 [Sedimentisphaerales bacterium]|nr:hypothetical protein [Sedimentisphaerales bacterium]
MSAAYKLIGFCVLLTLVLQVTAVAQTTPPVVLDAPVTTPATGPTSTLAPPADLNKPAFAAYLAESTGDNVNIRSGPAEVYYNVGQLSKGERFIVVDELHGMKNWAKIKPTPQCFSYIAREFVTLIDYPAEMSEPEAAPAPENQTPPTADNMASPTTNETTTSTDSESTPSSADVAPFGCEIILGEVSGDNVRVRAGSLKVPPAHASEVQTLLNKGTIVKIIGRRDDYYKIICPPNSYFWVSLDFVKRIGPADETTMAELARLAGQDVLNPPTLDKPTANQKNRQERQRYLQAVEMLEALQAVPILQRDFTPVKSVIDELLQSESSLIQRHARGLAKMTLRMEEAQQVVVKAQQQDEQLKTTLAKINDQLETLAAVSPSGATNDAIVVQGALGYSAIFTAPTQNRRFTVSNEEGKITYYAVSANPAINLTEWIGKRISMTGRAEYDSFSKIRILHVQNLVELPPAEEPD